MISRKDIERLAALKSDQGILSAYIRLDPRLRFLRRQPVIQFKGALKKAEGRLQSQWQRALERESTRVLRFLSNSEFPGRGLVIFSCQPDNLWEVLQLDVLVSNTVEFDTTTKTAMLAKVVEEFPRLVVALLQRDKATIYTAQQRVTERDARITTEVPGQHEQGGRSQLRFERHIEFHVAEHLKAVLAELKNLAGVAPFKLVLGGTDEVVDEMLKILPEPIRRSYIGRFPVNYKHDTENQIFEHAEHLWSQCEQFEEKKLVDLVLDAAKSDNRGVLGAEPTVEALTQERVGMLLIAEGLVIDGFVCGRCDYFSASKVSACPLCGGAVQQRDIGNHAVEKAILTGADVEVVSSEQARAQLADDGGIGASLRY